MAQPPFGANDPGPRFRSTVVEGDGSIGPGFDDDEAKTSSQAEDTLVAPPKKRSFFGFIRSRYDTKAEDTHIEPEKKPIRCFECGHIHEVSVAASSTQCARCSLYISLSDQEIREHYSRNIRTRGDVVIHRKGSVIGCEIACHNLTVLGKISGSVDCSGNAIFKNSGKVLGSMHCKHIVVDKKCELDFPQGIIAESADIYGVVRGDILCSGTVHIFKTGSVLGDATAKAIVMKDGGVLTGQMNIQHDVDISLPKKGAPRSEQAEPVENISAPPLPEKNVKKSADKVKSKKKTSKNKNTQEVTTTKPADKKSKGAPDTSKEKTDSKITLSKEKDNAKKNSKGDDPDEKTFE
ncbi:MAG: polymer-forming cytoskeletal protein, partial [Verrucomicrobia bacterium]|nr:polymer-forming cytoskeletal protein [Verrucomicrobiota bacterium]